MCGQPGASLSRHDEDFKDVLSVFGSGEEVLTTRRCSIAARPIHQVSISPSRCGPQLTACASAVSPPRPTGI
jgi:hypothetical protein